MTTTTLSQSPPMAGTGSYSPGDEAGSQKKGMSLPSPSAQSGQVQDPTKLAFQIIDACTYTPKYLGSSDQEALGCDCTESWDGDANRACGEDSDCINRVTKVECVDSECSCGSKCQNQRFQLRQYAAVSVIKTEKKGFGLQAQTDLRANDFIYEYIGEVINEPTFRRRTIQYDEQGIKHFYFMSLQSGVFVDATKKGNLGRFCNHSCNPNCYVDKWVVDDKLRMGIFAKRKIRAGEELVFDYNVDRYGADPQPCYCGEPNCVGFIGGKKQTGGTTTLPINTLDALGIDDGDEYWDVAAPKKPKKKRNGYVDADYVDSSERKELDVDHVVKVTTALMQNKEKWVVVKLLERIRSARNEQVYNRVCQLHGYKILGKMLQTWNDDFNITLQILEILHKFPRLTKNKIIDSKIEDMVKTVAASEDEKVQSRASALLQDWSTLEVAYRIPRLTADAKGRLARDRPDHYDRRESGRDEQKVDRATTSRSQSPEAPKVLLAPTGPRNHSNTNDSPKPVWPRKPHRSLPHGWFAAQSEGGTYYYSAAGETSWIRPTVPSAQPPPPPKATATNRQLQDIIDNITKEKEKEKVTPAATPQPTAEPATVKKESKEKWRSYSEEKKKKLYENTLFPHIKHVMNKYKTKLSRDDLKRYGKEVAKKLVNSDFKNNRVENPTEISARQEKQVKKYVKEYLDKAVTKKRLHEEKRSQRKELKGELVVPSPDTPMGSTSTPVKDEEGKDTPSDGDELMIDTNGDDADDVESEVEGEPEVKAEDDADAEMLDTAAGNDGLSPS